MKTLWIKHKGQQQKLECSDAVVNVLLSKDTDPSVKEMLINSLLGNRLDNSLPLNSQSEGNSWQSPESQPEGSSSSPESQPEGNSSTPECQCEGNSQSSAESQSKGVSHSSPESHSIDSCQLSQIHVWKGNEEDLLVSLRHDKHEQFTRTKNHSLLWKGIAEEVNNTLDCKITPTQAMNKYFSLKKRWKEVVDSATGTETKSFRQKDQFDQQYGTKVSTKPHFLLDSGKVVLGNHNTDGEISACAGSKLKEKQKERKTKTKRKSTEIIEVLGRQHTEFQQKMEQQHLAKMSRLDRFLDLFEKDVNSKTKAN